ncbi:hypothetical protein, partial [Glutamicibacter sp. AOP33-2CA-4]|uniref:hypothetical protein n=1 Tax=Glutamicibacter sp. AOP33-2CA-4 TaxID=3457690 RepID=UPI0040345BE7
AQKLSSGSHQKYLDPEETDNRLSHQRLLYCQNVRTRGPLDKSLITRAAYVIQQLSLDHSSAR